MTSFFFNIYPFLYTGRYQDEKFKADLRRCQNCPLSKKLKKLDEKNHALFSSCEGARLMYEGKHAEGSFHVGKVVNGGEDVVTADCEGQVTFRLRERK